MVTLFRYCFAIFLASKPIPIAVVLRDSVLRSCTNSFQVREVMVQCFIRFLKYFDLVYWFENIWLMLSLLGNC